MIELEGDLDVTATPGETMEFLLDPERFSRCLPNLESMHRLDGGGGFEAKFKLEVPPGLGVGYLSTVGAKMRFSIAEGDEAGGAGGPGRRRVLISGEGRAVGSKIGIRLELTVAGTAAAAASIAWRATLEGGLLARVMGEEAFTQMAGTVVAEISEKIGRELGPEDAGGPLHGGLPFA